MYRLYYLGFILCVFFGGVTRAANELYINGQAGAIASSSPTLFDSTCQIFVNGEIINNQGLFVNSGGTIELTGNWTNTPTAANVYQSTGTEKFYGTGQQTISGTMNGTTKSAAGFDNQFYNLKVYRNSTLTTTPAKYITLFNTNVNVANTVDFESATPNTTWAGSGANQAVIRTDPSSPSNVGNYAYELYLRNPSASALTNYAAISGNGTVKYIEGKLRRQVNAAATYDFPVGFTPGYKDGMEGFSIKFNSAPTSKSILGHIEDQSQAVLYRNILCDVGKDPGPGDDPFPNCTTGGPDGIFDLYYLDATNDLSHDWKATASDALGTIDYDITLYPGTQLDDLSKYKAIPAACGSPYQSKLLRVIAKDGIVGGTTQPGPGNWFPFIHLTTFVWCQFPAASSQAITLGNQTSFSTFRLHGTNLYSGTGLPVQLTSFTIVPVNNSYFRLDWTTASELNCYGFEVQRSIDGSDFNSIGFVRGNGTTNIVHNYSLEDNNVIPELVYYYRLKQVDTDGKLHYSNIIKSKLQGANDLFISGFYPNPTTTSSTLDIFTPEATSVNMDVYDILGQIVSRYEKNLTQGFNKISFDFSSLSKSTYIVEFKANNKTITKKLVKQ
ncbi:MAG: T9SS type A sorting domain-containing protein [Chitinophagales bacterium]